MFPKLLAILLAIVVTAAGLLAIRQERLAIAHEAAQIHRRLHRRQTELWQLQAEIAERCRPDRVRLSLGGPDALEETWMPIPTRLPVVAPTGVRVADSDTPGDLGG